MVCLAQECQVTCCELTYIIYAAMHTQSSFGRQSGRGSPGLQLVEFSVAKCVIPPSLSWLTATGLLYNNSEFAASTVPVKTSAMVDKVSRVLFVFIVAIL